MIDPRNPDSIAAALESANEARRKELVCAWTYDPDYYSWDTACGDKFIFDEEGPAENHHRFCPHCGKTIAVTPYEAPAEEADDDGDE